MDASLLPVLLGLAVLLPLGSFFVIWLSAQWLGKSAGLLASGAIGSSCFLSFICFLFIWLPTHWPAGASHHDSPSAHEFPPAGGHTRSPSPSAKHGSTSGLPLRLVAAQAPHPDTVETRATASAESSGEGESHHETVAYTGEDYTFAQFGPLRILISC